MKRRLPCLIASICLLGLPLLSPAIAHPTSEPLSTSFKASPENRADLLNFIAETGPAVGTISVSPIAVPGGVPTPITVSAKITNPLVIRNSLRLTEISGTSAPRVLATLEGGPDGIYKGVYRADIPTNSSIKLAVSASVEGLAQPVVSAPVTVMGIAVPEHFKVNAAELGTGGPLALNNFDNAYIQGGILPGYGAAEIDITAVTLPTGPLDEFIARELSDSKIISREPMKVGSRSCMSVLYSDMFTEKLIYTSETVYCPLEQLLYKFIVSFLAGDPKQDLFLSNLRQVLDSAQLAP